MIRAEPKEAAGRVLTAGVAGPDLAANEREILSDLAPGGIILFGRNMVTEERLSRLIGDLLNLLPPSPWLAIDQEGGRVNRLEPFLGPTVSAAERGRLGGEAVEAFGRQTGELLAGFGFNLDFAPVVDLCPADAPNGIGDRSFGEEPSRTAELAGRFLAGLQGAGVAGCLKHFPGLGDTRVDSHLVLPVCSRPLEQMRRKDLLPFKLLADRAAAVMICHAAYTDPGLSEETGGSSPGPATLSPRIVHGLLREELGYPGMVATDDMEMGALAPLDRGGSAAVAAIQAGVDMVLYCADLEKALAARDAMAREAAEDPAFARRLMDAATRVEETAARWPVRPTLPGRSGS